MSVTAHAHGRVNLIGEHVDYAGGLVLPKLIGAKVEVSAALRADGKLRAESVQHGTVIRDLGDRPSGHWSDYVLGAAVLTGAPGLSITIHSDVPEGAGVSSSAALSVAVLRALDDLMGLGLAPLPMARLAQRIEAEFTGTACGLMDPLVIAAAKPGEALLIDCESGSYRNERLFPGFSFPVIHSGEARRLAGGAYNDRRAAVERAAREIGVTSLRDADPDSVEDLADPVLRARARHVVSEMVRVDLAMAALRAGQPRSFGVLMRESHRSLAADFEVSTPALDALVRAMNDSGAYGARLTGAGFGGCAVALVPTDQVEHWWALVHHRCPQAWAVELTQP